MPDPLPSQFAPFEGPCLHVYGQRLRILFDGRASNGRNSVVSLECDPGDVVPPHAHPGTDEIFQVIAGTFDFWIKGAWVPIPAGQVVYAPRGCMHGFRNTGEAEGRLIATYTPAGFEKLLLEVDHLTRKGEVTDAAIQDISDRYGIVNLDEARWRAER